MWQKKKHALRQTPRRTFVATAELEIVLEIQFKKFEQVSSLMCYQQYVLHTSSLLRSTSDHPFAHPSLFPSLVSTHDPPPAPKLVQLLAYTVLGHSHSTVGERGRLVPRPSVLNSAPPAKSQPLVQPRNKLHRYI